MAEQTSVIPTNWKTVNHTCLELKLFDRPFSDGYNVYGDTIYLLYSLNSTLHCSLAYRASIRPGKRRSAAANIYGDAVPQAGHTLFEIDTFLEIRLTPTRS